MKATKATAEVAYREALTEVRILLRDFQTKLDEHERRAAGDPRNWGFVGDLQHYRAQLESMLGIEYRTETDNENREIEVTRIYDGAQLVLTFDEIGSANPVDAINLARTVAESCWG